MEEKSREQEMSAREISLIRELAQIRKEYKRELEYEKFDVYELPPTVRLEIMDNLRREMIEIFSGRNIF